MIASMHKFDSSGVIHDTLACTTRSAAAVPSSGRRATLAGLGAGLLGTALPGRTQTSAPPLRVILPVGAGSGVDTIMRSAQNALIKALGGRAVVIENLPGAGGITGTLAIVKAAPDGNTIGIVSNN